jgi:hypothetical protein
MFCIHYILSSRLPYVCVGWLVHGARTRAVFQLLCVCMFTLQRERREQISAHFLSHADDSCIERASGKDLICGFPHRTLGDISRTLEKAKQRNTALLVGKLSFNIENVTYFRSNAITHPCSFHPVYCRP